MKPTIGRIVLFTISDAMDAVNGARTFPAIITMVHSESLVNLRVFLDADAGRLDERKTSVPRADLPGQSYTWCWPPRD